MEKVKTWCPGPGGPVDKSAENQGREFDPGSQKILRAVGNLVDAPQLQAQVLQLLKPA